MRRTSGFTLIEMVLVIVLLGIVGLSFGNIVGQGMNIYVDTTAREALAQKGRFITDRMLKELRNAVPGSVRISESNTCIEWLPIKNTAIYETIPVAPEADTEIRILPEISLEADDRLVIYPLDTSELYAASISSDSSVATVKEAVSFSAGSSTSMVDVTLSASHSFPASSPAKRLYLYDNPKAYCKVGSQILLYKGYGLGNDKFSVTGIPMADSISDVSFTAATAGLQRNAQIKMVLEFTDNNIGETLRFDHNVLIHNTP